MIIPAAEGPSIASGLDEPAWRTETAKLFGQFERIADAVSPEGGGAALGDAD